MCGRLATVLIDPHVVGENGEPPVWFLRVDPASEGRRPRVVPCFGDEFEVLRD